MYNFYPENLNSAFIYQNINQKAILDFMYGYDVPLNTYIINIFRDRPDNNPGAWFEFYNGKLMLVDFADLPTNHSDIIKMVMLRYNLNYTDTLHFIYNKFVLNSNINIEPVTKLQKTTIKNRVAIKYAITDYTQKDIDWWGLRDITTEQLLIDKVYSCSYFEFYSSRKRKLIKISNINNKLKLCYIFAHYISRAVKIYQPNDPYMRFITNCDESDIGMLQTINYNIPYIIITKSYKDCKVLLNLGYNAIYILNETALPPQEVLWFLCYFDYIYILMDNDLAGIAHSSRLKTHLTTFKLNSDIIILKYDFWNDTDSFYINDKFSLIDFLKYNIKYDIL